MRWKLGTVLVSVTAGLVVSAPFAFADSEANGGHCTYGDFSVNIQPHCDTDNSRGSNGDRLPKNNDQLDPVLDDLPPALDKLQPVA